MNPLDTHSLHLETAQLETIQRILCEYVPDLEVWAFGSRVSGGARATSDFDLVLITDKALSIRHMAQLKMAFTQSNLPFLVDIIDWSHTSESFQKVIKKNYVVLKTP